MASKRKTKKRMKNTMRKLEEQGVTNIVPVKTLSLDKFLGLVGIPLLMKKNITLDGIYEIDKTENDIEHLIDNKFKLIIYDDVFGYLEKYFDSKVDFDGTNFTTTFTRLDSEEIYLLKLELQVQQM